MKTQPGFKAPPHPSSWTKSRVQVYLVCNETWVAESAVTILNVEADQQGRDIVSFRCHHCDGVHNSLRRS